MEKNFTESHIAHRERKVVSIISLIIGAILLALKFYAYHITQSKAILSDGLESIVNVVAGFITMVVLFIAAMPADNDHPYGHGKVESMAATFEGGAILFAGVLIIIEGVQTLFHGARVYEISFGLWIIFIAGLINGILGYVLLSRGRKLHSEALRSSGSHLLTDSWTSVGIIIGLVLVKYTGLDWIDPLVAMIFGFGLIYAGGKILIQSGNTLLDAHDEETLKLILDLFEKNHRPGLIQIHYTRVIRSGGYHHIDCHMVVPEFWTVDLAHEFAHNFEETIMNEYPVNGELHVHLDPCKRLHCANCDLEKCPVRATEFIARKPFQMEELTSPTAKA
jgi:cation diffusion facilitator family transporter